MGIAAQDCGSTGYGLSKKQESNLTTYHPRVVV